MINKVLNYFILLYAFTLPISHAGISVGTIVLFALWLFEGKFKKKFEKIKNCKVTLFVLAFILFNFISLLWVESDNLKEALGYIRRYWYFLAIFPIYTSIKKEYIEKAIYAFLLGMTISMLLSWGIYFGIGDIKEVTQGSLSPFMYHVMYSAFLSFASLLALSLAIFEDSNIKKVLFITLFILFSIILFMGIGRTGQFIYVFTLILLLFKYDKINIKAVISILLLVTVAITIAYFDSNNFKQRIDDFQTDIIELKQENYCTSIGARVATWNIAYDTIKDNPILGLGIIDHLDFFKNSIKTDKNYKDCSILQTMQFYHGQYIEILSEVGFVGLALFILIFYYLATVKIENQLINNLKIITVTLFLLFFIVDVPFRRQFSLALFALISALIIAQKRFEEKDKNLK